MVGGGKGKEMGGVFFFGLPFPDLIAVDNNSKELPAHLPPRVT